MTILQEVVITDKNYHRPKTARYYPDDFFIEVLSDRVVSEEAKAQGVYITRGLVKDFNGVMSSPDSISCLSSSQLIPKNSLRCTHFEGNKVVICIDHRQSRPDSTLSQN